jgi:hypothetical protein
MLEALNQFLEHKGRTGDRRIEGGSEAGAGPGGNWPRKTTSTWGIPLPTA